MAVLNDVAIPSLALTIFLVQVYLTESFQPIYSCTSTKTRISPNRIIHHQALQSKPNREDNDEDDDNSDRAGMNDAFKALNDLSSLDFGNDEQQISSTSIKADDDVLNSLKGSDESSSPVEVKLYKEMFQELEAGDEDEIYDNVMDELIMSSDSISDQDPKTKGKKRVLQDADGIGSLLNDEEEALVAVEISQDTDEFMRRALEEAMDEVKLRTAENGGAPLPESILNDKEIMKEINAIFDKANDQLLDGISDIRDEQAVLTEAAAISRSDSLKDEEQRLAEAENSVSRLLDKVKGEALEVEKAVEDLKKAQEDLLDDPLMKAADMRSGGIVKQGALAGALLFSFRSIGEVLLLSGPNGSEHGIAAAVQGVIAIACAAYLAFA